MKKALILAVGLLLMGASVGTAFAYDSVKISLSSEINGQQVSREVPAKLVDGQVFAPVRASLDGIGVQVEWDAANKQVLLGADKSFILKVGTNKAIVNGQEVSMPAASTWDQGQVIAPVRLILEHFGSDVEWDNDKREVVVTYSETDKIANNYYRQPVAGEKDVLNTIDARYGWNIAKELGTIGSSTRGWGYRLAGTPKGQEASEYVYKKFKEIGLNPEYDKFPVLGMDFRDASLKLIDNGNLEIPVLPLTGTVPTTAAGLTGDLVWVNQGTKKDLAGVDLTGKIAVASGDLDCFPWFNELAYQCQLHGAIAVIYYNANYYAQDASGEAFYQPALSGSDTPTIPVMNTPINYGKKLQAMLEKGPVRAKLTSDVQNYPNATGANVIATIKGSKHPNEYVIMSAHKDANFYGFQDDSLGMGMLFTLAKAMVDSNYKPDRTILFVATDAEEAGSLDTYYTWLIGSWYYITNKVDKMGGKVVGDINLELMAAKEVDDLKVRSSDTLYTYLQNMTQGINQTAYSTPGIAVWNFMTSWDDSYCFSYYGIPGATTDYLYEAVDTKYYHSQFDTEKRADFGKYQDCMKIYSTMVMRLDKLPVNPYNLSVTPGKYVEAVKADALQQLLPNSGLIPAAQGYQKNAQDLWAKQVRISTLYQQAAAAGKDLKAVDPLIVAYNNALRNTATTAIMGTQYLDQGADTYLAPYYIKEVSAFDSAIASLSAGDGQKMLDDLSSAMLYVYYSEFMEKKTFEESFKEPLNIDTWKANLFWAKGRVQKYYDLYDTLDSIRTKVAAGNKDFTPEIATIKEVRADAFSRLNKAVTTDQTMWQKADSQLPLALADQILNLLSK